MTEREFYNAVLTLELSEEMKKETEARIEKLDAKNERRRNSEDKAKKEVASRRLIVLGALTDELQTAEQLSVATGIEVSKVTGAMGALVKTGKAVKEAVKVDKSRKMAYRLPSAES